MVNLLDFISESKLFRKLKVDDLLFTEYRCLIDEDRGEVWSHTNYFAFGLRGKKMWQTIKGNYTVEPGDLLFIKKGANVVYQYFEEDFLVLFIFIPDEFIKTVIDKYQLRLESKKSKNIDTLIYVKCDEILNSYFQSLMSYFTKTKPPSESLLKLKFEELIVGLLTNDGNTQLAGCFGDIYYNSKTSIKEIMEANFSNNLSLEEYARLSARSLSTFKRDFFSIYKKTPGRWLTEKRLEHSRYLIKNTNKSIEEIIYESGFRNRSHFTSIFKEKYGTTPVKFRLSKHHLRRVV